MEPLALASRLNASHFALLYSSLRTPYSGGESLLAVEPVETVEAEDFLGLERVVAKGGGRFEGAWFGMLCYGLRHALEALPGGEPSPVSLPPLRFTRYAQVYHFDHECKRLTLYSGRPPLPLPDALARAELPPVTELRSGMSRAEYLAGVARLKEEIAAGALYQANLTRKFHGHFAAAPDALSLFARLCEASPAPYSALFRWGEEAVISSSPERFLAVDAAGEAQSRPIKGTAPLSVPAESLALSVKDRAENLMIVDLMRNDFARACEPGSVRVEKLFEVESFATLHHLASTVRGRLAEGASALDLVKACFPPGSMTGAPKIRAMQACAELEKVERGVYSGALGWFGGDGSADLSVVIRTLVLRGARFEFQVGGGIVADSEPEAEWRETMLKAQGLCKAMGIEAGRLEGI